MSNFNVRSLKVDDYTLWDELLNNCSYATIYHTSGWLNLFDNSDYEKKIYGYFIDNELVGGLCFFSYKKKIFTIAKNNINATPYGGFVIKNIYSKTSDKESFEKNVITELLKISHFNEYAGFYISNPPGFQDVRPLTNMGWNSQVMYTYYIDLNTDIDKLISKNARYNVRKALKHNIEIIEENSASMFYDLLKKTYSKHNLKPPLSYDFLEKVIEMIQATNSGQMYIARTLEGNIAAAEIVLWHNQRAYSWTSASNAEFKNTAAPTLLFYHILNKMKEKQLEEINLTTANTPRLAQFSSSFNPTLVPHYFLSKTDKKYEILNLLYSFIN